MRRALPIGAALTGLLVLLGAAATRGLFADGAALAGLAAVLVLLLAYGLAGALGAPWTARHEPEALRWATRLGAAAGAVYVGEVLLEYVVLPADNTLWGLAEFGTVFLIFFLAGALASWRTGRIRSGSAAGAWTALAAALIWYAAVLCVFYAFRGSGRQTAVLRAEGDFEDFRRSGAGDLQVFLMGDFLGAGFFHLLLSPIVGALLGGAGGLLGVAARRVGRLGST